MVKPFKSIDGTCPDGYKLNPFSGNCVECGPGKVINPATGRCVNIMSKTLTKVYVPSKLPVDVVSIKTTKTTKTKKTPLTRINKELKTLSRQIKISEMKFNSLRNLKSKLLKQKSDTIKRKPRKIDKQRNTY